jgi:azurin
MKIKFLSMALAVGLISGLTLFTSCDNNDPGGKGDTNAPTTTPLPDGTEAEDKNAEDKADEMATQQAMSKEFTVKTVGNDMAAMDYDVKELKVAAGSAVKVTLQNTSSDKSMMHNFVVVKPENAQSVATAGIKAGQANNWVPAENVIAASKLVGPGESTTLEFTAPTEKGTYKYICTYPGHYPKMQGTLIVE